MVSINISFIYILWCLSYGEARLANPATEARFPVTGMCECAAFFGKINPIFIYNPLNITCDDKAIEMCLNVCTINAQLSKKHDLQILCTNLIEADAIQPIIFARVCNKNWVQTNITAIESISCYDGVSVSCQEQELWCYYDWGWKILYADFILFIILCMFLSSYDLLLDRLHEALRQHRRLRRIIQNRNH